MHCRIGSKWLIIDLFHFPFPFSFSFDQHCKWGLLSMISKFKENWQLIENNALLLFLYFALHSSYWLNFSNESKWLRRSGSANLSQTRKVTVGEISWTQTESAVCCRTQKRPLRIGCVVSSPMCQKESKRCARWVVSTLRKRSSQAFCCWWDAYWPRICRYKLKRLQDLGGHRHQPVTGNVIPDKVKGFERVFPKCAST